MNKENLPAKSWKNPHYCANEGSARLSESLLRGNTLRKKAASGWALGSFLIELPTPSTLTALAVAGFDFVVLDMEHSSVGFAALESLIVAGQAVGLTVLVRTWGEGSGLIGKVLDMGAHGIMAPHVATPERARAIVEQARFKPTGNRGFSPLMKFDSLETPLHMLGEATYVVVQIEGKDGLARVADIAAVPGIDAIFVGPYDLALSMGVPPGSAEVHRAAERLAATVPAHLALGIYIDDPASCGEWAARRFALQCVSFDGRMLADGACRVAGMAQNGVKEKLGHR
jgi:2-keto-3-deoxy-L-rhamnonate aldolase RhmA